MRLDTVVVGMDFSPTAVAAAKWTSRALAPRAKIALVHAIEPPARPPFPVADTLPPESLEIDARAQATDRLRELAEGLGLNLGRVEVRVGQSADVVRQYAVDVCADLVVVGPHGNHGHRSLLLGTTADALVRGASIPVLVGSRVPLHGATRVVAGVADGAASARVLEWADYAADQLDGRLTTIYAIEPAAYAHMASMAVVHTHGDPIAEELELASQRHRQAVRWLDSRAHVRIDRSRVDAVADEGLAADVILDHALREGAALIVLGGHENAPALPPRLGRTVRHVLHEARCAVLIVPPA